MFNTLSDLQQPLFIDTNIDYDLDMSKFPGLNDPEYMYQPALLIATDWNNVVQDPDNTVISVDDAAVSTDMDQVITTDVISTDDIDADTFQTLVHDISSDEEIFTCTMDGCDTSPDLSSLSQEDIQHIAEYILDYTFLYSDISETLCRHNTETIESFPTLETTNCKRFKTGVVDFHDDTKQSKTNDYPTSIPQTYSTWHRNADHCVLSCRMP